MSEPVPAERNIQKVEEDICKMMENLNIHTHKKESPVILHSREDFLKTLNGQKDILTLEKEFSSMDEERGSLLVRQRGSKNELKDHGREGGRNNKERGEKKEKERKEKEKGVGGETKRTRGVEHFRLGRGQGKEGKEEKEEKELRKEEEFFRHLVVQPWWQEDMKKFQCEEAQLAEIISFLVRFFGDLWKNLVEDLRASDARRQQGLPPFLGETTFRDVRDLLTSDKRQRIRLSRRGLHTAFVVQSSPQGMESQGTKDLLCKGLTKALGKAFLWEEEDTSPNEKAVKVRPRFLGRRARALKKRFTEVSSVTGCLLEEGANVRAPRIVGMEFFLRTGTFPSWDLVVGCTGDCESSAMAHGTVVHGQVESFIHYFVETKCTDVRGWIRATKGVDPCAIMLLLKLAKDGIFPVLGEFQTFYETVQIATSIDILGLKRFAIPPLHKGRTAQRLEPSFSSEKLADGSEAPSCILEHPKGRDRSFAAKGEPSFCGLVAIEVKTGHERDAYLPPDPLLDQDVQLHNSLVSRRFPFSGRPFCILDYMTDCPFWRHCLQVLMSVDMTESTFKVGFAEAYIFRACRGARIVLSYPVSDFLVKFLDPYSTSIFSCPLPPHARLEERKTMYTSEVAKVTRKILWDVCSRNEQ